MELLGLSRIKCPLNFLVYAKDLILVSYKFGHKFTSLCRFIVDDLKVKSGSGGGRVVKLLVCGARGPGFDSPPRHLNFRDLLSPTFKLRYG